MAASPSELVKALQAQAHEELRGAAPGRTVGEATQNVVIIHAKSIQRRGLVAVPQCHAVDAAAERSEEHSLDIQGARLELPDNHVAPST